MNETETNIRDNYQRLPSMLISSLSLRPFFFLCPKAYSFPRQCKFPLQNFPKPIFNDHKVMLNSKLLGYTHGSCAESFFFSFSLFSVQLLSGNLSFAAFSNTALSYAYSNDEGEANGINFLHLMEERGVRANSQTYLWLLDGCLSSGWFSDGWKLHGKILKMGFCAEVVLCERLMDLYRHFVTWMVQSRCLMKCL